MSENKHLKEKMFSVIYQPALEGGYTASVPDLPGCYSEGETLEETKKNIQEAIELYLEESENNENGMMGAFIGTVMVHA